jgi:hypothetical protein
MKKTQIQQGDVILESISALPKGLKKLNHLKLAEGEHTGNFHAANLGALFLLGEDMFFQTENAAIINHQEHLPVEVPPGTYRVGIVREYDPFLEETRRVVD